MPCHIIQKQGIPVVLIGKEFDSKSLLGLGRDLNPHPPTPEENTLALSHWENILIFKN